MTTTDERRRIIHRRPRVGSGRRRSFHAPDETWMRALKSCQDRGISLGSQLVRALERIAAGETL